MSAQETKQRKLPRLYEPTITLYDGSQLPQIGAGTWKHSDEVAPKAIYTSLQLGYRLLDGACDYGNERACGEGLRLAIADGVVRREDVWVASKLWQTFHARQHVRAAVMKSLEDWGVGYFDLYYIHFPISLAYVPFDTRYPPGWFHDGESQVRHAKVPLQETWEALEELVDEGLIRHLGVSNFNSALLMDLLKYARVKPAVLQIEIHPYNAQPRAVAYAQSRGLAVTAYSSFGPQGFLELRMPKAVHAPSLFMQPVITQIADEHHKTQAEVLLKWALQRGLAIIPKADDVRLQEQNIRVGDGSWRLGDEEMERINGLDMGLRFNDPADDFEGCNIFS
ncbi:Aldo/keto reductase [Fomitopsis betulina]|nr:Aldo/keto reductase [Fomitopsis betulina]